MNKKNLKKNAHDCRLWANIEQTNFLSNVISGVFG